MKSVEKVKFCPEALAAWPYSKKDRYIQCGQWPEKGVDLSAKEWESLQFEAHTSGRPIMVDESGMPYVGQLVIIKPTNEQVDINRRAAYANPVSGSDAYFVEYQRKQAAGDLEGAEIAKQNWLSRAEEIKAENPYP